MLAEDTQEKDTQEKPSSSAEAYEEVLRRLRSGEIGAEDRIVDKVLAAEMNMSRMPAREALLRLVNEGYLVGTTRGFRLPKLARADVVEIFEIRKLLEPKAAASAAAVIAAPALARMEQAFDGARRAARDGDVTALMRANESFRSIWLEAVPNRRLVEVISRYYDHVTFVRALTLHDKVAREVAIELTGQLMDGFQRRDTLLIFQRMEVFLNAGCERYLELNA